MNGGTVLRTRMNTGDFGRIRNAGEGRKTHTQILIRSLFQINFVLKKGVTHGKGNDKNAARPRNGREA